MTTASAPASLPLLVPVEGAANQFVWVGVAPSVAAFWQVSFAPAAPVAR